MKHRLTGALALAAVGLLFGAGNSYAYDAGVYTSSSNGWADWTEDGDKLAVCDRYADGYGVRGYIYIPNSASDPGNGTVLLKGDDPSADGACKYFTKNISETVHISIKVCEYAGDVVKYCRYTAIR
ncbi:hypothetical protein ACFYWX_23865 [Streptomyces sp. NPDC002888]|uniref:hypothetical protein n=1 Tax=Streptomyces sp. NPDC002888 TaxID=3364668 RepID=UPI0036C061B7